MKCSALYQSPYAKPACGYVCHRYRLGGMPITGQTPYI